MAGAKTYVLALSLGVLGHHCPGTADAQSVQLNVPSPAQTIHLPTVPGRVKAAIDYPAIPMPSRHRPFSRDDIVALRDETTLGHLPASDIDVEPHCSFVTIRRECEPDALQPGIARVTAIEEFTTSGIPAYEFWRPAPQEAETLMSRTLAIITENKDTALYSEIAMARLNKFLVRVEYRPHEAELPIYETGLMIEDLAQFRAMRAAITQQFKQGDYMQAASLIRQNAQSGLRKPASRLEL